MRVFSYVVDKDGGYSPNPFHRVCTLACCKPGVRRGARPGDIIIGLTGIALGHRLVYAMVVSERMSFQGYWHDPRFLVKRPDMRSRRAVDRRGDNHYEPMPDGTFKQHASRHTNDDGSERADMKQRDLGPDQSNPVLVGTRFCFFGRESIPLPAEMSFLIVGRGVRCRLTEAQIRLVSEMVATLPQGIQAPPRLWPEDDDSWRPGGEGHMVADQDPQERTPSCAPRKVRADRRPGSCT